MSTSLPVVSRLNASQLASAEQTLVSAFAADPMTAYLFPRPSQRAKGLQAIFRVGLRQSLWYGEVDTAEDCQGVALWLHSERSRMNIGQMWQAGYLRAGLAMGWGGSRRVLRFLHFIERVRLSSMARPHWYLLSLAVAPERQVRGLGTTLLRHGIARAKAQGLACYLETTRDRNVAFYEKHGFSLTRQAPSPNGGPVVWSMMAAAT
jgi:ribosomal protein S18 acetylase RimI-like enzyme